MFIEVTQATTNREKIPVNIFHIVYLEDQKVHVSSSDILKVCESKAQIQNRINEALKQMKKNLLE
jgi:hypothetical protein